MADPLTPPAQGSAEKPGARSFSSRSEKRSVAKSPVSLQVGFYNIEWTESQLSGHDHETHRKQLGRDCAQALEFHDLGKQLGMFGFGKGCIAESSQCILCPGQLLALGALQGLWLRTLVVRVVVELGG